MKLGREGLDLGCGREVGWVVEAVPGMCVRGEYAQNALKEKVQGLLLLHSRMHSLFVVAQDYILSLRHGLTSDLKGST